MAFLIQAFAIVDVDRFIRFAPQERILSAGGCRETNYYSVDAGGHLRDADNPGDIEFEEVDLGNTAHRRGLYFLLTPTEDQDISGQHLLAIEAGCPLGVTLAGFVFELFNVVRNPSGHPHLVAFCAGETDPE